MDYPVVVLILVICWYIELVAIDSASGADASGLDLPRIRREPVILRDP